jgi:hypothetical protein
MTGTGSYYILYIEYTLNYNVTSLVELRNYYICRLCLTYGVAERSSNNAAKQHSERRYAH